VSTPEKVFLPRKEGFLSAKLLLATIVFTKADLCQSYHLKKKYSGMKS
jgi:hypothetical protein